MILNDEQTTIVANPTYECLFTKQKFGRAFFRDEVSPLGNIITFVSSCKIGPLIFGKSIVICGELLNTDMFGAACFQRLYAAQLGSLLFSYHKKDSVMDEGVIFVDGKQFSLSSVNKVKSDTTFHIFFPLETSNEHFTTLELINEQVAEIQQHAVDCFNKLTKSVFLETQRDNI